MTNTTREAALEAALKLARNRLQACAIDHPTGSREMYERSEWADEATAALATPATEPQGYVEGLEAAISKAAKGVASMVADWYKVAPHSQHLPADLIEKRINRYLAARPAPQPAVDTRVVTVAQLDKLAWLVEYCCPAGTVISEIRAIIGTATPAPSDKMLVFAAQTFCNRVEAGEIRSKRSYAMFKDALNQMGVK